MSGRIAAIAAAKEDGKLTVYVGSASGGGGSPPTAAPPSSQFLTRNLSNPSARSPLIRKFQRFCGLEPVKPDSQQRFNRQWYLQIHRRWRQLDQYGPA
jgi:hypothetical protein